MNKTITVEQDIPAPLERVFTAWTTPNDLMNWYSAGDGWTIPKAEVDAKVGGRFLIQFLSPDGAQGFDFTGTFTKLDRPTTIEYTIDDGRTVMITLEDRGGVTHATETFEMENQNTEDLQRGGWSAQLKHLAEYLSSDSKS